MYGPCTRPVYTTRVHDCVRPSVRTSSAVYMARTRPRTRDLYTAMYEHVHGCVWDVYTTMYMARNVPFSAV